MPNADLLFVPFQLPKTVRTNTTAVIMELTNFMSDILPEDSSHSACHEIPYLLQNMKVHYCIHNPPPTDSCYQPHESSPHLSLTLWHQKSTKVIAKNMAAI